MRHLVWDRANYELGIENGVLYPKNSPGVVWNGLVSVDENEDGDVTTRYQDGVKIQHRRKPGDFSGTISAFTYPDELEPFLARNQRKETFGLSYTTKTEEAYRIHLVYNVLVNSAGYIYQSQEVDAFTWNFTTKPEAVPGQKPSAHIIIEALHAYPWVMEAIEDLLYGSDAVMPSLPSPTDIFQLFEDNSILRVTDHGDGTFTVDGPDEAIMMLDPTTFEITWPSAIYLDSETYKIYSL